MATITGAVHVGEQYTASIYDYDSQIVPTDTFDEAVQHLKEEIEKAVNAKVKIIDESFSGRTSILTFEVC